MRKTTDRYGKVTYYPPLLVSIDSDERELLCESSLDDLEPTDGYIEDF